MSIQSWKKEFYPSEASTIKTHKGAVKHCIRKWTGLLPSNLKKHGLKVNERDERTIEEKSESNNSFPITDGTCALCQQYPMYCTGCPLKDALGLSCTEDDMPFDVWCEDRDPRPMLTALREALVLIKKGKISAGKPSR